MKRLIYAVLFLSGTLLAQVDFSYLTIRHVTLITTTAIDFSERQQIIARDQTAGKGNELPLIASASLQRLQRQSRYRATSMGCYRIRSYKSSKLIRICEVIDSS